MPVMPTPTRLIPTESLPGATTIVLRIYGLDLLDAMKAELLRKMIGNQFKQPVSQYRGNIVLYIEPPASEKLADYLYSLQIFLYQIRFAISPDLAMAIEFEFVRG